MMEQLYIVSKNKMAADYGSDPELLVTKLRHKLKKVRGKPQGNSDMT